MLGKRFPSFLHHSLTVLALVVLLISTAWAKPKFKILHRISGGLFSGLTFDAKGNLYGVTGGGGDHNQGTIFELKPGAHGWTLTTLYSFGGSDGMAAPNGRMIFDEAGSLYGTTQFGGTYDGGAVFELVSGEGGWTLQALHDFSGSQGGPDGDNPQAGVVRNKTGALYGMTRQGGSHSVGIVYELTPNQGAWNENIVLTFDGANGSSPYDGLILDETGNMYGTSIQGGAYAASTIFRLKRTSEGWKERLLYSFCPAGFPCKDGQGPYAGVVLDDGGNLFGTAGGGKNACNGGGCGIVFKLKHNPNGWHQVLLHQFTGGENGSGPTGGVILDKVGNLYGATVTGGIGQCFAGCGVVYELAADAGGKWKYTVLHRFNGGDGAQPLGGLILDKKGNLYGTAYDVLFEITP